MLRRERRTLCANVSIALAALLLSTMYIAFGLTSDWQPQSGAAIAIALTVNLCFIASGLVARIRGHERVGALLLANGAVLMAQGFFVSDEGIISVIGAASSFLLVPLFVQLVVSYPTGRVTGRVARILVRVAWAIPVVVIPLVAPFYDPRSEDPAAPVNPLLVSESDLAHTISLNAPRVVGLIVGSVALALVLVRWRRASTVERRGAGAVLLCGGLTTLLFVVAAAVAVTTSDAAGGVIAGLALVPFAALPLVYLVGVLRERLDRSTSIALAVQGAASPGDLRDALAAALRDPSVELVLWSADQRAFVDELGEPVKTPGLLGQRHATLVRHGGDTVAAIVHDAALLRDRTLLEMVAAAAALAIARERVEDALRARVDELRASRVRLVEAADAERRRLERNLHDGAQQRLVALSLALRLADQRFESGDPVGGEALLDGALAELHLALGELTELGRGLHPAALAERGLGPALRQLAERSPVPVKLALALNGRLPEPVEAAAYFVVSEALANVAKYAGASCARVNVDRLDGALAVEVADDGVGGADPEAGSGLRGLADRLAALDGRLGLESAPGAGTTIRAVIPCVS